MAEGEFEFIAHRLRPLATAPGALRLLDDAALLDLIHRAVKDAGAVD